MLPSQKLFQGQKIDRLKYIEKNGSELKGFFPVWLISEYDFEVEASVMSVLVLYVLYLFQTREINSLNCYMFVLYVNEAGCLFCSCPFFLFSNIALLLHINVSIDFAYYSFHKSYSCEMNGLNLM